MVLLLFTDGVARKLQQKGCRSKETNNKKQGEKSFGEFKEAFDYDAGCKPVLDFSGILADF